ncbi:MAG: GNAT family N-acetyltransferase [Candidatus Obscuribacterales bacterium]|nr:GNAT family N-acetyltransferase [Candidatus Obscuribacterales bacterium]
MSELDLSAPEALTLAQAADVAEIAVLNKQFHLDIPDFRWDTEAWIAEEIDQGRYYVLRDAKGVAAALCLHVLTEQSVGGVEAIAVRADLRGSGLGKILVNHAQRLAQGLSLEALVVESFCAYGLEVFYTKCGFVRDDELQQFRGHDYYRFEMKF